MHHVNYSHRNQCGWLFNVGYFCPIIDIQCVNWKYAQGLGEYPGSWTHINSILTRKLSVVHGIYFHANLPTTLIGLFSVASVSSSCGLCHSPLANLIGEDSYCQFPMSNLGDKGCVSESIHAILPTIFWNEPVAETKHVPLTIQLVHPNFFFE